MRSISVQVDSSGKSIYEVYNFIPRNIKKSDAKEDIGEDNYLSTSSNIKFF